MKKLNILAFGLLLTSFFISCGESKQTQESDSEEVAEAPEDASKFVVNSEATQVNWRGEKITGSYHTGTVNVSEGHIETEGNQIVSGEFTVDMQSIRVTNVEDPKSLAKLTGHLKGPDFFEISTYPNANFAVTSSTADSLTGNLTIKGITHVITIPYTLNKMESGITAKSSFKVDRSKYDVRYGSGAFFEDLGDNLIEDDIQFDVNLVLE